MTTQTFNTEAAKQIINAAESRLAAGFDLPDATSRIRRRAFRALVSDVFRLVGQAHSAGIVNAPQEVPGWTTDYKQITAGRKDGSLVSSGFETMVRTVRDAAKDKLELHH